MVCYRLHAESITLPATAAHIHRGGATANGPVVVPFTAPAANGNSDGCVTAAPALIDERSSRTPRTSTSTSTRQSIQRRRCARSSAVAEGDEGPPRFKRGRLTAAAYGVVSDVSAEVPVPMSAAIWV